MYLLAARAISRASLPPAKIAVTLDRIRAVWLWEAKKGGAALQSRRVRTLA
jgi:hypothetical protein